MDKVFINPSEVRGLGNVIISKTADDFECYESTLTLSSGVYTLNFDGTTFLLEVSAQYVKSGGSVTVSVTLRDSDGEPVEDASVALYKVT